MLIPGDRSQSTTADTAPTSGLAHHWPLVRGLQDIVAGNDGQTTPSDSFRDGGLNFAGRGAGVLLARPDMANLAGSTATLSFHMKTTQRGHASATQAPGIFGHGPAGVLWGWLDERGRLRLSVGEPSSTNPGLASARAVNDGQWHAVVLTRDAATGALTLQVDGVKRSGKGPAGQLNPPAQPPMLGQLQGSADFFRGRLADVRVYNRVLAEWNADDALLAQEGTGGGFGKNNYYIA